MSPARRGPLLLSLAAHAALFAFLRRVDAPRDERGGLPLAMELELLPPLAPRSSARALPVEPVIERREHPRRAARTVARASVAPGEARSVPVEPAPATLPSGPAREARRALSGMGLLESMERDVAAQERVPAGARSGAPGAGASERRDPLAENVARITEHWQEEGYRHAPPPRPAGSSEYVRRVTAEAARAWSPVLAQNPSILDGMLRLLTAGAQGYRDATRDSLGVFASDRGAAASAELDAVHPGSPTLQPAITLNQAGRAAAQRIAVEIDVRQSADGAVLSARVARSSGTRWFDVQAEEAIRRAIATAGGPLRASASAGRGQRSRWEFELRLARNPPVSLAPQMPGALAPGTPGAPPVFNQLSGGVEWGGVDPPRAMYPFALHRYQRVRVLWVLPDGAPPTTTPRADAGA